MNKYGKLIDDLIWIKDHYDLTLTEMDTINEACNALEKEGEK